MNRNKVCTFALLALVMPLMAVNAAEPVATSLDASAAGEYLGSWNLAMEFQGNAVEMQLNVVEVDGKIGATIDNERMPEPTAITEASLDDSGITLTYEMDFGGNAFTIDIKGKVEDGVFTGSLAEQSGLFSTDVTGTKGGAADSAPATPSITPTDLDTVDAVDYLGFWNIVMNFNGNDVPMDINIVDVNGKIGAVISAEMIPEPATVSEASADESGIKLTYDMDFGGNQFSINITGRVTDGKLEGEFAEKSGLFKAAFSGEKGEASVASAGGDEGGEGRRRGGRGRRGGGTSAKVTIDGKDISIAFADIKMHSEENVYSEDYESLQNLKDGQVFKYVGGRAAKLRTDLHMIFGDTKVEAENAAPDYPGVYSVWLKKVSGDTWHLVFNEHADIWGTQHLDEADAHEVPIAHSKLDEPAETFKVELAEKGEGGTVKISYGEHQWTTDFTVQQVAE